MSISNSSSSGIDQGRVQRVNKQRGEIDGTLHLKYLFTRMYVRSVFQYLCNLLSLPYRLEHQNIPRDERNDVKMPK